MRTAHQHIKSVETVGRFANAREAARRMHEKAVGCLVVVDEAERPVGMLTDRDLCVRAVAESHTPADLSVEDVMTEDLVTASPDDTLTDLMATMRNHGIRRLPIVHDGAAIGLVSLDDVLGEFSRDLGDLAAGVRRKYRYSPAKSRFEHVRDGIERGIEGLKSRLEYAQWYTRDKLLAELDELRSKLRDDDD